ncbi:MAG: hypothetical protein K2G11_09260 [Muribaculaceae bacterium]|nr:hypothetical protein [Muribaculaceae bacterium]
MIDKTALNIEIREAADLFLSDIQLMSETELNDNLRYFAEKCKSIAEYILEQYVISVRNRYSEGEFAIKDITLLNNFVDFSSGYQAQMLEWIKDNQLNVEEQTFEIPSKPQADFSNRVKPKTIAISGTVIAVGLFIFSNIWIALAAELITCLATFIQKKRIAKSENQLLIEQKLYEQQLEAKKDSLVFGLISDLDKWLDKGVDASNEILKNFNL